MEQDCKQEHNYKELFAKVGQNRFDVRFSELQKLINDFLVESGYGDLVVCNERILYHVLLDYYSDLLRLMDFHEIENPKTDKVMAYLIFWILRRKPIQFKEVTAEEKDIFVNERFASTLMITECLLKDIDVILSEEQSKIFKKYVDFVLYYFKYRQVNPQVIELMIESFKIGRLFPYAEDIQE